MSTVVGSKPDKRNQDKGVGSDSLPLERFPRRRKLTQLMADHFLRDGNGQIVLSVVYHKLDSVLVDLCTHPISFRACQMPTRSKPIHSRQKHAPNEIR
jgi:hypothetical protein